MLVSVKQKFEVLKIFDTKYYANHENKYFFHSSFYTDISCNIIISETLN